MPVASKPQPVREVLSVIVPVLHEPRQIKARIDSLVEMAATDGAMEVIVVDGSPHGESLRSLHGLPLRTAIAPQGRSLQMNAGASLAIGTLLLFLHVDTELPFEAPSLIRQALAGQVIAGAFDLKIKSENVALKFIALTASLRSRLTRAPYGDQAIFVRKDYFSRMGMYAPIPIMEDVELMRRIRRQGDPITILKTPVYTSARRWEKEGVLRGTLRNWVLRLLYHLGVRPETLARAYRPHQGPPAQ